MDNLIIMTRSFNAGYILQKHQPDWVALFNAVVNDTSQLFVVGMTHCCRELGKDKLIEQDIGNEYDIWMMYENSI